MIMVIIAVWLGFLWILVTVGVFKKWHAWMKLSPIAIWLAVNIVMFLPMAWTAPSGPVTVLSRSVQIAPAVSGMVADVKIKGGGPLKEGDVLFTIDPVPYQAEVDAIKAKLALAKTRLDQKTQLLKTGAGKEVDVQQTQANFDQLTAQLSGANWNLEQTIVRAPTDGFVSNLVLRPGTRVNAGEAVLPFIDDSVQIIGVQIAQSHLRNIKIDQPADVIFNMYPGTTFAAKVAFIVRANPSGQVTPTGLAMGSRNTQPERFWLALLLDKKDVDLPPGAAGTAAIFTEQMPVTHVIRKITLRMQGWLNYVIGG
jgi:multidrug resistance efflux pump